MVDDSLVQSAEYRICTGQARGSRSGNEISPQSPYTYTYTYTSVCRGQRDGSDRHSHGLIVNKGTAPYASLALAAAAMVMCGGLGPRLRARVKEETVIDLYLIYISLHIPTYIPD